MQQCINISYIYICMIRDGNLNERGIVKIKNKNTILLSFIILLCIKRLLHFYLTILYGFIHLNPNIRNMSFPY